MKRIVKARKTMLHDYLMLAFTPRIGPISFAALMQKFGTASAALAATPEEIRPCLEHADKALPALLSRTAEKHVQAALAWRQQENCRLMTLLDDDYPMLLTEGIAPPPVLFLRGNAGLLNRPMITIVGSRKASAQALGTAETFARGLAQKGFTVVSGMAYGIDSAAHRGAVHESGSTIAVLGTGIDRVYPASNHELAHTIAAKGLLISEFPLGSKPVPANFPRRNRLIAALGRATVVIEATVKSGTLITARLAGEMGRDVMAVPGSIYNPQTAGCHLLIQQGAKLVTSADEICEEYLPAANGQTAAAQNAKPVFRQPETAGKYGQDILQQNAEPVFRQPETPPAADSLPDENPLLAAMGFDPVHPDTLSENLNRHPADILAALLELELAGTIAATSGGRYQRIR